MHVRRRADRGQATLLLLAVVALVAVTMMATAGFANRLLTREQAQVAADAAALAGCTGGRGAAARLASDNGGELVSFVTVDEVVQVVVRFGGVSATARATRAP
jgi:hypothetical protein